MIAVNQRAKIKSWIEQDLNTAQWKEYIRDAFTLQVLSAQKSWRGILEEVGKQATARYSSNIDTVHKIQKAVTKYLKKSPEQDLLKAKAYAWLKYIQEHRPCGALWFPHYAIEVAHGAFRLKGPVAKLKKYLSDPARKSKLHFIFSGAAFPVQIVI